VAVRARVRFRKILSIAWPFTVVDSMVLDVVTVASDSLVLGRDPPSISSGETGELARPPRSPDVDFGKIVVVCEDGHGLAIGSAAEHA